MCVHSGFRSIEILSGLSSPGTVRLVSKTHVAKAHYAKGQISVDVRVRPKVTGLLERVPRYLRFLGLVSLAVTLGSFAPDRSEAIGRLPKSSAFACLVACIVLTIISRSAKWHAAEHKVIAAYALAGDRVDMSDVKAASRVAKECGGGLFLPMIIAVGLAFHVVDTFTLPKWAEIALVVAAIDGVFWTDGVRRLSSIPLLEQVSRCLQTCFTTREPGHRELTTAMAALQGLVDAGGGLRSGVADGHVRS